MTGTGLGTLEAFVDALQTTLERDIVITQYDEHALPEGTSASAVCYIRLKENGCLKTGMASHNDVMSASLEAVLNCLT